MAACLPIGLSDRLPVGYFQALINGGATNQEGLIKAGQEAVRSYHEQEEVVSAARVRMEEGRIIKK